MHNILSNDLEHIYTHTQGLWSELRNANLFITGGTGFFGKWLLESLLWVNEKEHLNCRVTVLTRSLEIFRKRSPHLAQHPSLTFINGDVRDFEFPKGDFSHIIHAATEASDSLNKTNPLLMLDTIVQGTRHTLDFAKQCRANKFLLTSSGAVYGEQPSNLSHIPEEYNGAPDTLLPNSAYAQGKRVAEHLCSLYADSNLEIKIARCFAFVGPYLPLNTHFAAGNFVRDAIKGGPIIINGDGTPIRSYLYGADLAIWLWVILGSGKPLLPYNVGSEFEISIESVAMKIVQIMNKDIEIKIFKKPDSGSPIARYVPSTQRARKELGLNDLFEIDVKLERMVHWAKQKYNVKVN